MEEHFGSRNVVRLVERTACIAANDNSRLSRRSLTDPTKPEILCSSARIS